MQIKPDLSNINPDDLDESTLRNMHAIGINFATMKSNRLKPFESRATKRRKWRTYFASERNSQRTKVGGKQIEENDFVDYDCSRSNAENVKILQRRLAAWPTYE